MKDFEYVKKKANKKKIFKARVKVGKYLVMWWALPLCPFYIAWDKYCDWLYEIPEWDEEKAKKVLNRTLPYLLKYDEKKEEYYCSIERWSRDRSVMNRVPIGLKTWTSKYYSELLIYLIETYEKEGYTKKTEVSEWGDELSITFFPKK